MFLKNLSSPDSDPINLEGVLFIGSSEHSQVLVKDEKVKSCHARIEMKKDKVLLSDLKTETGTFVNGVRILESYLSLGDIIQIGDIEFIVDKEEELHSYIPTSKNTHWQEQLSRIPQIARTDLPVLILGPSGAGKELLSQYIHDTSHRRRGPIVRVNCSALSESLVESELFGHTKGSFTGATQDRKGAFEAARNGTLVLDEIGDLPISLQPKLLRALENKEIKPVGSDKVYKTNARIIACTHQDLRGNISKEKFREDLYYRLNVIQIFVPSLSQRMEDFEKILFELAKQYRVRFTCSAIKQMMKHSWPGNIRELKNVVARARFLKPQGDIDTIDIERLIGANPSESESMSISISQRTNQSNIFKEIEKQMIQRRLIINNGNQRRTAQDLGIPKSTLNDKIRNYKIPIP